MEYSLFFRDKVIFFCLNRGGAGAELTETTKNLKGLHQENLRDNMTNEELVMNMLAELTTTNITKEEHPQTMSEHARVAERKESRKLAQHETISRVTTAETGSGG